MDNRIKSLLSILAIFLMGVIAGYIVLDGAAKTQAIREAKEASRCEQEIASCHTGAHCRVMGRDLVTITAKGAR